MIDPWAWVFWLWIALFSYSVFLGAAGRIPRNKTVACEQHPFTDTCAHRKNLPPGKK